MFEANKSYSLDAQESDIYINYQKTEELPQPVPLGLITHKITGELVSHYNTAASFPYGHIPEDIGHIIGTLPGTGTHMFIKALALLGEPMIYAAHIDSFANRNQMLDVSLKNVKKIIVVRDPRDWLCASLRLKNLPEQIPYDPFSLKYGINVEYTHYMIDETIYPRISTDDVNRLRDEFNSLSKHEQLKKFITNPAPQYYGHIEQMYGCIFNFLNIPNVLFVRFEDMIDHEYVEGERYTSREKSLITIGNFLGLPLNDAIIRHAANNLPGDTWNYEPGTHTGYWKIHFTPEIVALFKEHLGTIVTRLGYEDNDDWGLEGKTYTNTLENDESVQSPKAKPGF